MYSHIAFVIISLKIITIEGICSNNTENYLDNIGCICETITCIRKCCAKGQYVADKNQCESTSENFTNALDEIAPENYFLIEKPCSGRHETLLLDPANVSEDAFKIADDGFLVMTASGDVYEEYCVDFVESMDVVRALLCFDVESDGKGFHHDTIGNI